MSGGISYPAVIALTLFDDGGGSALYAGGNFTHADRVEVNHIARWNGSEFSPLAEGVSSGQVLTSVYAMTTFEGASGSILYLGGDFMMASGTPARHVVQWNGLEFSPLAEGVNWGTYAASVRAITVFDDGTGPALYAGGYFTHAGDTEVNFIAKWNGNCWSALGEGVSEPVHALAVFDDGKGRALYAAGNFRRAGEVSANFIAKWNGSWSPVGAGVNASAHTLAVFDDGRGPALYAGGYFTVAGTAAANRIAKWNGTEWSSLGSGIQSDLPFPGVQALVVFDDGLGSALYVGGQFQIAGGRGANNIARWDGFDWFPLGSGIGAGDTLASVYAIGTVGDPLPVLYAGGLFTRAGEVSARYIAAWSGQCR